VGLPLANAFSKKFRVIGYDVNKRRIIELKKGIDSTGEVKNLQKNKINLQFFSDIKYLKNCKIFIVTVPTPVKKNNEPDLSNLKNACKSLSSVISKKTIIVFESTVYPGCTEEYCMPIIKKFSKLKYNKDFYLGYSPERINPGQSKKKLENIIKITSGSTSGTSNIIDSLYKKIIPAGTYKASSIKIAEAAKVIENTQRDINIAFVNELSILFNKLGLETSEVLEAAGTKWNFNKYYPGLVGGHCIGVDPYYLAFKAKKLGLKSKIILAGRKLNNEMASYIFDKIISQIDKNKKKYSDSCILILGATFKENCGDFRNSKVFDIMKKLDKRKINYSVVDPYYSNNINIDSSFKKNFCKFQHLDKKFDIILISVGHKYFKKLGIKKLKSKLKTKGKIFDLKSIFKKNNTSFRL
jgi:UDP-N-acetyl-D-galactosamine dehydrogenase